MEALQAKNAQAEVGLRSADIDKRERDRSIRIGSYQNIILKSHATDLFDIEMDLDDVLDLASLACPGISAQLRQVITQDEYSTLLYYSAKSSLVLLEVQGATHPSF